LEHRRRRSLTDRRHAASFTVLTGHRCGQHDHDWHALAKSGSTLVVLMAATTADHVATRLLAAGRPANEPVAFVHGAGTAQQRSEHVTLTEVVESGCPFASPVIMIGVRLRSGGRIVEHIPI
jgi:siroheme synthase